MKWKLCRVTNHVNIYKPRTIPGRYGSNFIDVCKHHAKSFTIAWSWTARDPVQVCPIFPCPWKGDRALRSSKGETRKTWMLSSHAALNRVHSQGCPAMQHHMTGNLNSRAQAPSPSVQANYNPEPLFVLPLFKQHKIFSLIGLLHADTAFSNLFRKMPVRSGSV